MWHTWLLYDNAIENPFYDAFLLQHNAEIGVRISSLTLTISLQDELGILDNNVDVERLFQNTKQRGALFFFTSAPPEELCRVFGTPGHTKERVWHWVNGLTNISLEWMAFDTDHQEDPYAFSFLKFVSVHEPKPNSQHVHRPSYTENPFLLLHATKLVLEQDVLNRMFNEDNETHWTAFNGLFLPPYRTTEHRDHTPSCFYFSSHNQAVRKELCQRLTQIKANNTTAMILWRCLDIPLLRDLLIDGSSICVDGPEGPERNCFFFQIPQQNSLQDPIARYRASFFLRDRNIQNNETLNNLYLISITTSRSLAYQINNVFQGLKFSFARNPSEGRFCWDDSFVYNDTPPVAYVDFAHVVQSIAKMMHGSLAFETPFRIYQNDNARRFFSVRYWRCPWDEAEENKRNWIAHSWRDVMQFLTQEAYGFTPEQGYRNIDSLLSNDLREQNGNNIESFVAQTNDLYFTSAPKYGSLPENFWRWRLCLPPNVLLKRAPLVLGQTYGLLGRATIGK